MSATKLGIEDGVINRTEKIKRFTDREILLEVLRQVDSLKMQVSYLVDVNEWMYKIYVRPTLVKNGLVKDTGDAVNSRIAVGAPWTLDENEDKSHWTI